MLYGSKTGCLRENEIAILKKAERYIVKVMCSVKLVDKRNTEELMDMLVLKEAADPLERVNGVRWYSDVLIKAMVHVVDGKCKQGQSRMKWRLV